MKIIPECLKKGDEIRIVAPSRNANILSDETIEIAKSTLESMGFVVTFGKSIRNCFDSLYDTASIEDRVNDLMEAFKDKNVKGILTVIGGFNVNQIIEHLDYDVIKNNPKVICGYSDITALLVSITAKTGLVTYYGPHFSTFGIKKDNDFTIECFNKMIKNNEVVSVVPSNKWSNDMWFIDQENREFIKNDGMEIITSGKASGTILGGNLCTLNLLQGTEFFPNYDGDIILFIEDDGMAADNFLKEFDRNLISLIQAIGRNKIKGIVVGRAELNCHMTIDKWNHLFNDKGLDNIPIVVNADFGHTNPMLTIPLGGSAEINVDSTITINIKA